MSENHTLSIAVIGSGPAGYYAAEALSKASSDERPVEVDVIDQLPTPFGLIRAGVAPDHQSIKNVAKRYEKTAMQDNVRFLGNVSIGKDVQIEELMTIYDAVILAIGASASRKLNIDGADKQGVIGSAEFVGWYNSHPHHAELKPKLNIDSAVIIGNGNVAVDVCRILAKTTEEMAETDLAHYAGKTIHATPIETIWMFGRRGPMEAKFTPKELSELGELKQCVTITKPEQLPDDIPADTLPKEQGVKKKILGHLKEFSTPRPAKIQTLNIEFYASPVSVIGNERVEGIRMERTRVEDGRTLGTGHFFDVPCQLIIPCIGYRTVPIEGVPFDTDAGHFRNTDGHVRDNLYVTGWARRGPSGTIGTNRPDAQEVAARVIEEIKPKANNARQKIDDLLQKRHISHVSFRDWQKIDAAELAAAKYTAPREKFATIDTMLKTISEN